MLLVNKGTHYDRSTMSWSLLQHQKNTKYKIQIQLMGFTWSEWDSGPERWEKLPWKHSSLRFRLPLYMYSLTLLKVSCNFSPLDTTNFSENWAKASWTAGSRKRLKNFPLFSIYAALGIRESVSSFQKVVPIFWSPMCNKPGSISGKQILVKRFGRKLDLDQIIAGTQLKQPLIKHSFNS